MAPKTDDGNAKPGASKHVKDWASAARECGAALKEWALFGVTVISLIVAYRKLTKDA